MTPKHSFVVLLSLTIVLVAAGGQSAAVEGLSPPRREALHLAKALGPETMSAEEKRVAALSSYLEGVMDTWPHVAKPATAVDYAELATTIARVAIHDESAWPSDTSRVRSALLLASLAYWEGARFAEYVDDGSCNRWAMQAWKAGRAVSTGSVSFLTGKPLTHWEPNWRVLPDEAKTLLHFGTCDGGIAHSLWQIHETHLYQPDGTIENVTGAKLADREYAAHVALALARRSLHAGAGLCHYSGETESCPKAKLRLQFAADALRKNPPPPDL